MLFNDGKPVKSNLSQGGVPNQQYVTDENGNPTWEDKSSGGGSQTMDVNIIDENGVWEWSCDKPYEEIKTAFDSGAILICRAYRNDDEVRNLFGVYTSVSLIYISDPDMPFFPATPALLFARLARNGDGYIADGFIIHEDDSVTIADNADFIVENLHVRERIIIHANDKKYELAVDANGQLVVEEL